MTESEHARLDKIEAMLQVTLEAICALATRVAGTPMVLTRQKFLGKTYAHLLTVTTGDPYQSGSGPRVFITLDTWSGSGLLYNISEPGRSCALAREGAIFDNPVVIHVYSCW